MLYKCIEYPRVGICKIYQMTLSDRSYGKYWPLNLNLKPWKKSPPLHSVTKKQNMNLILIWLDSSYSLCITALSLKVSQVGKFASKSIKTNSERESLSTADLGLVIPYIFVSPKHPYLYSGILALILSTKSV